MRPVAPLAACLAAVALTTAGCGLGGGGAGTAIPAAAKAPPQTAELGWSEPYPSTGPALVFGVESFTVTRTGWSARISIANRSDVAWTVGNPDAPAALSFGVMLFPNADAGELETRMRANDLPAIRPATSFDPPLPDMLRVGQRWSGTMSAPGALAGGFWVRLAFGPLVSIGDPPPDTVPNVVWFTDHAHRLEQAETEPP